MAEPQLIKLPWLLNLLRRFDFPHKKGVLNWFFGKKLSSQGLGWVKTWNGFIWLIDTRNHCHRWMVFDRYADSAFLKWVEKNLPENAVIVDSGANIGQFIPYYARVAPHGKIFAFEPSAKLFNWIQTCLKKNNMNQVLPLPFALGESDGKALLTNVDENAIHGLWNTISDKGSEEISVKRLDNLLEQEGIFMVDLWKLDVEEYEVMALKGADTLLAKRAIRALYIELTPTRNNHEKIIEYLKPFGYRGFKFEKSKLVPIQSLPTHKIDGLFLPDR